MNNYLPTEYQSFIHLSRYSRWLPDEGRRETWIETVSRLRNYMQIHLKKNLGVEIDSELADDINRTLILEQVELGVAIRMSVIEHLLNNSEHKNNV